MQFLIRIQKYAYRYISKMYSIRIDYQNTLDVIASAIS